MTTKEAAFLFLAQQTDDAAVRLVRKLAHAAGAKAEHLDDRLRAALEARYGPPEPGPISEAHVARAALVLAADSDPGHLMAVAGAAEAQGVLATIAVLTAAIVILQTELKVTRADGKVTVEVHKRPASDNLLATFVKGVLGLK